MLTLYQFPISHFCEKVRWALDYKKLEYKKVNLLPGLHAKKAKKLSGKSTLPILVDKRIILGESSKIISYLDYAYPNHSLTPEDDFLKQQALEWEKFADDELGPDVRSICYNTLLNHPEITIPFFTKNGPWYGNPLLKYMFPKMSIQMRAWMKLDEKNAVIIQERLKRALEKLYCQTQNHEFLVGNSFTRADLSVAALLAPLCRPGKYGLEWPEKYPEPLHSTINQYGNKLDWVRLMYGLYR